MMKRKKSAIIALTLVTASLCVAQMPVNGGAPTSAALPSSFDASGSSVKQATDDPAHRGETPNPQILGMEIPLMDPSTDTVKYNGGLFDVGNNAAVRARFEKFLQQVPDDTAESKRYRALFEEMLRLTRKSGRDKDYAVGGKTLIQVGKMLYAASDYPADGQQSGTLATAIVSALDVQREVLRRDRENERLETDIKDLLLKADKFQNSNVHRKTAVSVGNAKLGDKMGGKIDSGGDLNALRIAHYAKTAGKKEATQAANLATNEATKIASKINYQSVLMTMLLSRRFDHACIGARVYRFIYRDGDTKLNLDKNSKANEVFTGGLGLPPVVNSIDSLASNMRREVDQSIQAVYGMLARNKLAEATQHLIEAVAIGEYMQSVATFPTDARQRIARYWTLRKRALTALNARDYATVEEVAAKMKEMDVDFDDSMLLSYTTGKKRQSDLAIRNASKALRAGNEEDFNKYITEAGIIWPRNPNLDKGTEMLAKIDEGEPVKDEFRRLYEGKEYRRIAREREHFKIVAMDPDLSKKYEEVIELVMRMDGMLAQIKEVAKQDNSIGPCMAYEKLVEWQKDNEKFANDSEMTLTLREIESNAHDFVQALRDGEACESHGEYGSALACFYKAQCKYPQSTIAKDGIKRVMNVIVKASYA